MGVRHLACAILTWPLIAHAQSSLVATQVGTHEEPLGAPTAATCSADACRVTLPVYVAQIGCVLNVRVSAPTRRGWGTVFFAAGPCERRFQVSIATGRDRYTYGLDSFGAATDTYQLVFVPASSATNPDGRFGTSDNLYHPYVRVRLDIIATHRQ